MNTHNFSILICRGIGLLLLLVGVASVALALVSLTYRDAVLELSASGATGGWTAYTPYIPPHATPTFGDFVVALDRMLVTRMPLVLAGLAGIVLLLFSRPIGKLLAHGLSDPID